VREESVEDRYLDLVDELVGVAGVTPPRGGGGFGRSALRFENKIFAMFVRVLSRELGPRNVTVNAISPGFNNTDLLPDRDREVAAGMSPFARVGQPKDVADVAVFLAGDEARWITGQNIAAGGGVF
jgi:hypothetical protein